MTELSKLYKCWCGFESDERTEMFVHSPEMNTPIFLADGSFRDVHYFETISAEHFNAVTKRLNEIEGR